MKKLSALLIAFVSFMMVQAQDSAIVPGAKDTIPNSVDTSAPKTLHIITPDQSLENSAPAPSPVKKPLAMGINNHAKDHLLIQLGYDNWSNKNDSIHMKGISRSFAIYLMYDFPFKTNPHLSVGAGLGISSSNIYFKNTNLDITGKSNSSLNFGSGGGDTTHFKKYKLLTTYLEAPIELRYVKDPLHPKTSFKAAAGVKLGTMLSAGSKAKNPLNSTGQVISTYVEKEKSKRYFNTTRISATARVGFGALSLFGNYQINQFIKSGAGPDVRPYTVGITISGL
jgi:hypothetical protein